MLLYSIDRAGEARGAADGAARGAHAHQDESGGARPQLQVARRAVRARQDQLFGCARLQYEYTPLHHMLANDHATNRNLCPPLIVAHVMSVLDARSCSAKEQEAEPRGDWHAHEEGDREVPRCYCMYISSRLNPTRTRIIHVRSPVSTQLGVHLFVIVCQYGRMSMYMYKIPHVGEALD